MHVAFLGIVGDCCEDGGQPPFGWWVTILRKIVTIWRRWWLTIHGNPGYHPWAGKSPKYGDHPMDGGFPLDRLENFDHFGEGDLPRDSDHLKNGEHHRDGDHPRDEGCLMDFYHPKGWLLNFGSIES